MKQIVIFFFILSNIAGFSQQQLSKLLKQYNTESIPYITVEELKNEENDLILLDSREIKEYQTSHIKDAIFHFQAADIQTVAATEKTDDLIYNVDLTKPTAIIMGSEDRGINPSILKIVDFKAKLPLLGTIESLNVSVACGAFLYEATRQRIQ